MTVELENYIKKEANKNKILSTIDSASIKKYRIFLKGLLRTENPIKIWECEDRNHLDQVSSFKFAISHLTKTLENETIKMGGKIQMDAHISTKEVPNSGKYLYNLSNEVYAKPTEDHIYELARDKDMYVGIMGGFTNHLQLLDHIVKENPKIEVNFVDINSNQIIYNMLLATQFNNFGKYQVATYKEEENFASYTGSESKDLFPLSARVYNEALSEFLKTGIKEKKKVFIHASNAITAYYYDTDDILYLRQYIHSPDLPTNILDSFLKNENIEPGSVMMIVGMKYFLYGSLRVIPDDAVFIEKTENGFTTYAYENNKNGTSILSLKRIRDESDDDGDT